MRFDEFWSDDAAEPVAELPLLPAGSHSGEIVEVGWKDLKFKVSDQNKRGTSLVIKVDVPGYQVTEAIIPAQYRGLIEAVCRAARQHVPSKDEDWDCGCLKGQVVRIDTEIGTGKTGREFVRIAKWHKGADPLPKAIKATPARTPAAKVEAAGQGGEPDDIPFAWLVALVTAALSMGVA